MCQNPEKPRNIVLIIFGVTEKKKWNELEENIEYYNIPADTIFLLFPKKSKIWIQKTCVFQVSRVFCETEKRQPGGNLRKYHRVCTH